jgi:hypothetical protein
MKAAALFISYVLSCDAFAGVPPSVTTSVSSSSSSIVLASDAGERRAAKATFDELISQGASSSKIDEALSALVLLNPTPLPGAADELQTGGRWVVQHAPHIAAGGSFLRTKFVPEYHFHSDGKTSSYVSYNSAIFGKGWLNADGVYSPADGGKAVTIEFERFWVDVGTELPSLEPPAEGSQSLAAAAIQNLGAAGFIKQFSYFPITYLDEDLCVFKFPPLRTQIAARRAPPLV